MYKYNSQNTLIDVEYYHNRKYKVTQNTAVREEKKYDCCVEPYLNVLYTIGFQRKPEGGETCEKHWWAEMRPGFTDGRVGVFNGMKYFLNLIIKN